MTYRRVSLAPQFSAPYSTRSKCIFCIYTTPTLGLFCSEAVVAGDVDSLRASCRNWTSQSLVQTFCNPYPAEKRPNTLMR